MTYEQQLCADVRARKARLWNPPAARQPQKMDSPSIAPAPALMSSLPAIPVVAAQITDPIHLSVKRLGKLTELQNEMSALLERVRAELSINAEPVEREPQTPFRSIVETVCIYYSIKSVDLLSARRTHHIVRARQVVMYLAKQLTLRTLPDIGRRLGGRDHTTILHGVRRITELRTVNEELDRELIDLTAILTGKSQEQPHAAP